MIEQKSSGKLILHGLLLLIIFFGLVRVFMSGIGYFIRLELIGTLFLLVIAMIGFVSYRSDFGERILFFVYLFHIGNFVLIWYFRGTFFFVLLALSLLGFLISLPKKSVRSDSVSDSVPNVNEEPHSMVFDKDESEKEVVEVKSNVSKSTTKKSSVTSKHSPGKFVASKQSNVYHVPKCDWAKRISKARMVWFKKKEDAWEKGYKAHSCVE